MYKVDIRESEKHLKNKLGRKQRRNAKLQDLERQLEFAESRCGTLKQQLDYLKKFYGCMKDTNLEEKHASREEGHGDGSDVNQFNCNEFSKWNNFNTSLPNRGTTIEKESTVGQSPLVEEQTRVVLTWADA